MEIAESQSDQPEGRRKFSDQENQLRCVVVSLIGQFQAYISDLLDELCDDLPDAWEALQPFQKRYITVQLRRRLETVLTDFPEEELAVEWAHERFKNAVTTCSEWPQRPAVLEESTHRQELYGFLKDNSSKSLDRAISQFRPDGMKFTDWLYKNHAKYRGIFETLDNAIQLRNDAAHGRVAQRATLRDVRIYRAVVYRLIQKADEYLERA